MTSTSTPTPALAADFLQEAAHFAHRYAGKAIVIKFGGELLTQENVMRNLVRQAIALRNFGAKVVLVHGGGVQINDKLKEAGIEPKYDDATGVRDTDLATLEITHSCLSELNRRIVNCFTEEAIRNDEVVSAVGLGGNDGHMITATAKFPGSRTGTIARVNSEKLDAYASNDVLIFHPICMGTDGKGMNVNADEVAAELAISMKADRLILCSNVSGVWDKDKKRISLLQTDEIQTLIADGTIKNGMIPKIKSAALVADHPDVGGVVILDGADPHAIESELFSRKGAGTLIQKRPDSPKPDLVPVRNI